VSVLLRRSVPCEACGGEGYKYTSRYGGNDPDVWRTGMCEACTGTGWQQCEDCGDSNATMEYVDPQKPLNRFLLCKSCFDKWTAEDAEDLS